MYEKHVSGNPTNQDLTARIHRELVASLGFHTQFKYDDRVKNIGTQSGDHEAAMIRAFVQGDKQERFLSFLANPKNRKKFTESLSHFGAVVISVR